MWKGDVRFGYDPAKKESKRAQGFAYLDFVLSVVFVTWALENVVRTP